MNGGVSALLAPSAKGGYEALWPDESGIVLPSDSTSAAAVDINQDGWQDLVIATNDGLPRCYLQRQTDSTKPYTLLLRGLTGNEHAVGSQVIVTSQAGTRTAHVVCAGESYLTQSSPRLYLPSRPTRVTVRWPDGAHSEHTVAESEGPSLEVSHPRRTNSASAHTSK